jgi:predicted DNA-binding transcriptional regulator AlpA
MERNPDFPKRIKLGERAVGFDAAEVDAYVEKIITQGSIFFRNKGE